MTECRQIESLLPLFVDGEADDHQVRQVEAHLALCATCRDSVPVERAARAILRAHRAALIADAPPGLRTRILAGLREADAHLHAARFGGRAPGRPRLGWLGRATAAAGAAAVVIVGLTLAEFIPVRSSVLFAAQVAVDHVRCLFLGASTIPADGARAMEREIHEHYGWTVRVPASDADTGVALVGARRCPWGVGPHAHLLYRVDGHTMSLYITPGVEQADAAMSMLGHMERVWSSEGRTYAMVARGVPTARMDRIEAYFRSSTAPVTTPNPGP